MDKRVLEQIDYVYKLLFILALLITAIILVKSLAIPLLLGAFISFAILPVNKKLERRGIKRVPAILITFLLSMTLLGLFIWLVTSEIISLASNLPNLEDKLDRFTLSIQHFLTDKFNLDTTQQNLYLKKATDNATVYLSNFLLSTTNVLATLLQIPVYVFLFLLYRDNIKQFLLSYFPIEKPEGKDSWLQQIRVLMQGYVSGMLLVILIIATLNTTGLLILGIDYAIFFGVFSAFLTVIPYIGNFIGASLPVLMALITKDNAWTALAVIGLYIFVQFLEGNIITPRIMGSKVSINPLAAIVGLLIGGEILGIAGMIMSIPAMGVIKVILDHSRYLRPFSLLITETDRKNEPIPETFTEVKS